MIEWLNKYCTQLSQTTVSDLSVSYKFMSIQVCHSELCETAGILTTRAQFSPEENISSVIAKELMDSFISFDLEKVGHFQEDFKAISKGRQKLKILFILSWTVESVSFSSILNVHNCMCIVCKGVNEHVKVGWRLRELELFASKC